MTRDEIIHIAVMNGFYKNDEGIVTSPFIEDVDISELLLDFADDIAAMQRTKSSEKAWIALVKHKQPWNVRQDVTEAILKKDEA